MEEMLLRFSHLGEDILDSLDNQSLANCQKVCRTWKRLIEDKKFPWIRIIKKHDEKSNEKHIDCQLKWRKMFQKIRIVDVMEFGRKLILEEDNSSVIHLACIYGHSKIVEIFMQKVAEVNIDFNAKDEYGYKL